MSSDFNPYQPRPMGEPAMGMPGQRPAVAMVFGVLNLVFGILGICGNIFSAGGLIAMNQMNLNEEVMPQMQQFQDPVFIGFLSMQMLLSSIVAIVGIIAGVGLVKFQPWGRKLSNTYAIASLILLVIGFGFSLFYTVIPAFQQANQGNDPAQVGGAIGGAVGGLFGGCFGAIYPICILVFLNRSQFVAAIENQRSA